MPIKCDSTNNNDYNQKGKKKKPPKNQQQKQTNIQAFTVSRTTSGNLNTGNIQSEQNGICMMKRVRVHVCVCVKRVIDKSLYTKFQ